MKSILIVAVASILLYITSVNGVTNCRKPRKCKRKAVTDDEIDCQASKVCLGSTLTATDTISCSSDYACYKANSLTAANDIICNQTYSCGETNIQSTNGDVYCNAESSCDTTTINAENIYCGSINGGERSCQESNLTATDTISCSTDYACFGKSTKLTATNDIICSSDYACNKANSLTSTNGDVYCNNRGSCSVTTINAQNIYCGSANGGEYSCSKADLNAVKDITLAVGYAAYQTDVIAGGDIYVTARVGAYYGRLTGTNIYIQVAYGAHQASRFKARESVHCIGERACAHGQGIVALGNSLYVEFNGLYAGGDISVTCPPAGDCTIVCANRGCEAITPDRYETNILYTPGGTSLTVDPIECEPTAQDRPDYCPTFKKRRAAEIVEMIEGIENEEFPSPEDMNEEIVEDDFMAYVGVGLNQGEMDGLDSYSYIAIGVSIIVISVMVIGAYIYFSYYGRNKYEIIQ